MFHAQYIFITLERTRGNEKVLESREGSQEPQSGAPLGLHPHFPQVLLIVHTPQQHVHDRG
jgi:hypothetical protein